MAAPRLYPSLVKSARPLWPALMRGFRKRCPSCGEGRMFGAYLKVSDNCPHCGEELFHHQADDAPPYFTIVIVGHIVVSLLLAVELEYMPPIWVHLSIWPAMTLISSLWLLPRIKGSVVSGQWAMYMHGFGEERDA
jgi:uncharacterized protein (DUF983 family)